MARFQCQRCGNLPFGSRYVDFVRCNIRRRQEISLRSPESTPAANHIATDNRAASTCGSPHVHRCNLGRKVGLWQTPPVVTASVWALTAGVLHLLHLGEFLETDNAFRSRAVALLGPSTILAAFMGVAVLSFWGELFLIPVLSALVLVVNANRSNGLTIVCSVLLLIYVGGSISMVIIDWGSTETMRSLRQAILFPFVLTIGALPYIQLLVVAERIRFGRSKMREDGAGDWAIMENDWPLTVTSAKLCCKFQAVWVEVNGRKYGLNGTDGTKCGCIVWLPCFELNDIWRDNPDSETMGLKVNIGRLIRDGLALERQC